MTRTSGARAGLERQSSLKNWTKTKKKCRWCKILKNSGFKHCLNCGGVFK